MFTRKNNRGYIYIASNKAMPGLVKIGMTAKQPKKRLQELYTTGVPFPFKLHYECQVKDARNTEQLLHQLLDAYRVSKKREFFEIEPGNAIRITERTVCSIRTVERGRSWSRWILLILIVAALA
ncbi:MAG: GIY-YIG nuclease family protein, partial [Pseudomonadota bacterium]